MQLQPERNLNRHIMITGESGAGKSNACKLILRQLAEQGANFLVLDPHAEYTEAAKDLHAQVYDASIHAVNPFDLDGLTERERTNEIAAMLKRILRLGEVQYTLLHRCISYLYQKSFERDARPTMHGLVFWLGRFAANARSKPEANIYEGLKKRLSAVSGEDFSRSVPLAKVMNGRSVFSLQGLHSAEAQAVYMESMLRKIYTSLLTEGQSSGKSNRRRLYIAIDEAEKLQDSPVIGRLVAEGRKYGVGLVAISQRAKALDKEIRSNAATIIAFAQREPEEQSYVANMIAAGTEYNRFLEVRKGLRELPRGYALVQEARDRTPKVVRCMRFEAKERDPSGRIMETAKRAVSKRELLGQLGKEGFSQGETISAITEMIRAGLLKYHVVTEPPYEGSWYIAMPRNSAEHDIMVSLISRYLTENGIRNRIYDNSYGPDVIAYKDGKRVAVEYETGKKNFEETKRMLEKRSEKYAEVVVLP